MIYDISEHSLDSLLEDERLVSSLMDTKPMLTTNEIKDKITRAYLTCEEFEKPEPVKSNDHQPCTTCGSTDFVRTGTCFACQTCGSSQGCS